MHPFKYKERTFVFLLYTAFSIFNFGHSLLAEPKPQKNGKVYHLLLPVDHSDSSKGSFKGYFVVGPNQSQFQPPVFFIADGQMNMIREDKDCSDYIEWFAGAPFILPCVRGFSPELLEKCKRYNGTIDMEMARRVFSSWHR